MNLNKESFSKIWTEQTYAQTGNISVINWSKNKAVPVELSLTLTCNDITLIQYGKFIHIQFGIVRYIQYCCAPILTKASALVVGLCGY